MINFFILDTETTGLKCGFHEINQLSILRVIDKVQKTFQIKVKRPHIYSQQALDVQGITPADLKQGIPIEEAVRLANQFLEEDSQTKAHRCIIAHNAPFDRKFVHQAWTDAGSEFPADLWLCTQSFAKRHVQKYCNGEKIAKAQVDNGVEIKKDKYGSLKPKFGLNNFMVGVGLVPKIGAHSAEVDVQNTDVLYNWLMNSNTEYVSLITRSPHKDGQSQEFDVDDIGD